jgi:hypothetical protein
MRIRRRNITHMFDVVRNIDRPSILGRDFLNNEKAVIDFSLKRLQIRNEYIPLENDWQIARLISNKNTHILKPNTINIIQARLTPRNYFTPGQHVKTIELNDSLIIEEPYL